MARWTVKPIAELPVVASRDEDPVWYPLQHALGIDTFGANVFVARSDGQVLVSEHDEAGSGQQELYLVLEGAAVFFLDDEEMRVERGEVVAVTDPTVSRRATALTKGTALLVVGAADERFESTWNAGHFADIPGPS